MNIKKILVTTDFSEPSIRAFQLAISQAQQSSADITLVYVLEDLLAPALFHEFDIGAIDTNIIQKEFEQGVVKKLAHFAEMYFPKLKIKTSLIKKSSSVAISICEYAKENAIDLIVISAYGRGGILSFGSTTDKVLRHSPCPVLVVPRTQS